MPQSDAGFRRLAETVLDAILTIDESSVIVYANPAVERVFGYAPDEIVGKPLKNLMPEELRAAHAAGVNHHLATGERRIPWSGVELPAIHRDGRELTVEVSFTRMETDAGTRFTGIVRDVTERREEQRRIAASHAVAGVLADLPTSAETLYEVLRAICQSLGWQVGEYWAPAADADVMKLHDIWFDDDPALDAWEKRARAQLFARGQGLPGRVIVTGEAAWIESIPDDMNFPRMDLANELGFVSAFGFPVKAGAEVLGVMEFFSRRRVPADEALLEAMEAIGNQTGQFLRRRHAEEKVQGLLESERAARETAERAGERANFLAEAGHLLGASMTYESTIGSIVRLAVPVLADYSVLYLLEGDHARRVSFAHADPERIPLLEALARFPVERRFFERSFGSGPSLIEEIDSDTLGAYVKDPEHMAILDGLAPRSGMFVPLLARGELLGGVAFAYAESGRRYCEADLELAVELATRCGLALTNAKLYQEARDATLARDQLLAVVSHDLRNLLNSISLRSHLLAASEDPADRENNARLVKKTVEEMSTLIDDLLEMSRAEAGTLNMEVGACKPCELLERVTELMAPTAGDTHTIELRTMDEELPAVWADAARVGRVLTNLLSNAVKYTPAGSTITLAAEEEEGWVVFSVEDDGPGISGEDRDRVFHRYWRGRRSSRADGAGLGLSIAQSLVEAHGGRIWLESEPGAGATFRFSIPMAPDPPDGKRAEELEVRPA